MTTINYISEEKQDKFFKEILSVAKRLKITTRKDTKFEVHTEFGFQNNRYMKIESEADSKRGDYYARKQFWISFEFATTCVGLEKRNKLKINTSMVSPAGCSVSLNLTPTKLEKKPIGEYIEDLFVEYKKQWAVKLKERTDYLKIEKSKKDFKNSIKGYVEGHHVRKGKTKDWIPAELHGYRTNISVSDDGECDLDIHGITKEDVKALALTLRALKNG